MLKRACAQAGAILDGFSPALAAPQKAVRGAAAAFLLNLAILSTSDRLGLEVDAQALSAASTMLTGLPKEDEDALYRFLPPSSTHLLCAPYSRHIPMLPALHFDCGND